jgi:hypothetical protein
MDLDLYDAIEHTIDYAFQGKFRMNMYEYLKSNKSTRNTVEEFLMSCTAAEIKGIILDLEGYLEGGDDNLHKQLREGYGHLGKPEARKIKNYLESIINDAGRYMNEKRPGRRRKSTK